MASKILVHCQRCGQAFYVAVSRKETARFCSRACYFPDQAERDCLVCPNPIPQRYLSNSKIRFCSTKCATAYKVANKLFHPEPEVRFWAKIDKTPGHGPWGDCWVWTGGLDEDGYGKFRVDKKKVSVHKYSYQLHHGPVPKGMCVCHRCDVRNCARGDHLWLGDNAANTADMISKGRDKHLEGHDHPGAKLTNADVLAILRDNYHYQSELAEKYGVSKALICLIKKRKIWKHLTP